MDQISALEKFGQFVIENLRDNSIGFAEDLLAGKYQSEELLNLQNQLNSLNEDEKAITLFLVKTISDRVVHDFLFALQTRSDLQNDIKILVDGADITNISDGLQGEIYGEDGWCAKFSRYQVSE